MLTLILTKETEEKAVKVCEEIKDSLKNMKVIINPSDKELDPTAVMVNINRLGLVITIDIITPNDDPKIQSVIRL